MRSRARGLKWWRQSLVDTSRANARFGDANMLGKVQGKLYVVTAVFGFELTCIVSNRIYTYFGRTILIHHLFGSSTGDDR